MTLMLVLVLSLILCTGLINFYFSIQILRRVSVTGGGLSFFEIRWQVHKQLKNYKQITRDETGRVGIAYYGYWISLALMLAGIIFLLGMMTEGTGPRQ